jgi:hypothetical protein
MTSQPAYRAFTVKKAKNGQGKDLWVSIGAAWPHKDRKGIDVVLDALPLDSHVVLRVYEPRGRSASDRSPDAKSSYPRRGSYRDHDDNRRWH